MSQAFWSAILVAAQVLGTSPEVLVQVLNAESGINPAAQNSGGCVGINQFCGDTFASFVPMTKAAYLALPAEGQLPFVVNFWKSKPAQARQTARDLYWVNFVPSTWVPNAPESYDILAALSMTQRTAIARANPVLSQGRNTILASDLSRYLRESYAPIAAFVANALGRGGNV